MKKLVISMGDPAGIGPEITVKALAQFHGSAHQLTVVGDLAILEQYTTCDQERQALAATQVICPFPLNPGLVPGVVSAQGGQAAYHYVAEAAKMCLQKQVAAMITGPINKEALHLGGFKFSGHTEILAEICKTRDYTMFLSGAGLNVFHVSTHVALSEAIKRVKQPRLQTVIQLAMETLTKLGIASPRLAIAGLNPHAGENGLFGHEEFQEITPAVQWAKAQGWQVFGPEPPDTVFVNARKGKFDGVVAMYHDQGHIPLKVLGFDEGVNITVGLPIVRTSVDHGTAFDIVGQGLASPASLLKAIEMAIRLS